MKFRLPSAQWRTRLRLADIFDLTPLIGRILHQPERARIRIPSRMDLASKNPLGDPNCNARHDATDILTDTSPAFCPLFGHGLRQRPSCCPCTGLSLESMSSTTRSDRSKVSACPITSRFTAINPTRFASHVSNSVSNQCSVDVSVACRSIAAVIRSGETSDRLKARCFSPSGVTIMYSQTATSAGVRSHNPSGPTTP
jgi:hypothetical protein